MGARWLDAIYLLLIVLGKLAKSPTFTENLFCKLPIPRSHTDFCALTSRCNLGELDNNGSNADQVGVKNDK